MCGIFGIFSSGLSEAELRKELVSCSSRLRHRGPDWSGYKVLQESDTVFHGLAHERLAIMDPDSGEQPLSDGKVLVAANGEIYNYKELYQGLGFEYKPQTGSDCEVLLPLYQKHGVHMCEHLRGMFCFLLYDTEKQTYMAARDHIGITPLYIGWSKTDGSVYIASELKALVDRCSKFQNFPPGHYYYQGQFVRWYKPNWAPELKPGLPLPKNPYQAVCCFGLFDQRVSLSHTVSTGRSPPRL